MITLDEAIKHCYEIVNNECKNYGCRMDHKQLAEWLTELKKTKEQLMFLSFYIFICKSYEYTR